MHPERQRWSGGRSRPLALPWPAGALGVALCALALTGARAEIFQGAMADADWHLDASVFECRLAQPIPRFGTAVFTRRAGEDQRFVLQQSNRFLAPGEAGLRAEHPAWRETAEPEALGTVPVEEGDHPVSLDWQGSQRLAAELREGRRLIFTPSPWDGSAEAVEIVIEPVGFSRGMSGFHECLTGLLPVNFDQVARTALYFPQGYQGLPDDEREKLDRVALYASADDQIARFYIDGHTDGVGLRSENLELSRERAELVAEYLVERGVPADKIVTRWHGERYPVASNREPEGRAENRRVTVRLERTDDRLSAR